MEEGTSCQKFVKKLSRIGEATRLDGFGQEIVGDANPVFIGV